MSVIFDFSQREWEKSSYSNGSGGQCLEFVRNDSGLVPVRDSKNPTTALVIPAAAWSAFVDGLRHVVPPRS
ncbi:DUF397 domain-containing protein [Streptomyces sp. B6B3]|uniref:DUF397 domain-containing protein n=1 Tax=Streptomyces sp. B6B3 TaxID=3153570 RepID=UPI00325F391E